MGRKLLSAKGAGMIEKALKDLLHYTDDEVRAIDTAAAKKALKGVDRGDGRDVFGKFTGEGRYGSEYQEKGLARYEMETGRPIAGQEVSASHPGVGHGRRFDGVALKSDGTYEGIEVKGGSATKTANQRSFDEAISQSHPASARLNGKEISITSVSVKKVPS